MICKLISEDIKVLSYILKHHLQNSTKRPPRGFGGIRDGPLSLWRDAIWAVITEYFPGIVGVFFWQSGGMRKKLLAGCGMRKILLAECGMAPPSGDSTNPVEPDMLKQTLHNFFAVTQPFIWNFLFIIIFYKKMRLKIVKMPRKT